MLVCEIPPGSANKPGGLGLPLITRLMVTPRRTYIFALAAKFPLPFIHLNEFSWLGHPPFSHNNVIIIEIADSAQTEYCTTFH